MKKDPSALSMLKNKHFPGLSFYPADIKMAGKILKNEGDNAAIAFLTGKGKEEISNFQPPAKALIVAQSRPFVEWPICKASNTIQSFIYELSPQDLSIPGTSGQDIENWIKKTGLDLNGYWSVQGLNLIFNHAEKIYKGVLVKVQKKNEKNKKRIERNNSDRAKQGLDLLPLKEEQALGENGKLIHPPGINKSIYCYQQVTPKACKSLKDLEGIPSEYIGYYRNPDEIIKSDHIDRLKIPPGSPGYVPEWQRPFLNSNKKQRRRKWYSNQNLRLKNRRKPTNYSSELLLRARAEGALLCQISIENDWVLFDARGLLRNLQWRGLVPMDGFSLNDILKQFTGDPVIDPERNVITFVYKPGVVNVHSKKITRTKNAPNLLKNLTTDKSVCMLSIDLGQNNPVSAKFSTISTKDGELCAELVARQLLPKYLLAEIISYRNRSDKLNEEIRKTARDLLDIKYQEEFNAVDRDTPQETLNRIGDKLKIDVSNLPLDRMSSNTSYIADVYLTMGYESSTVMFTPSQKKGSSKTLTPQKRKDKFFAQEFKLRLSKEAREAMNEKVWELQRQSPEYKKLSQRKREFARCCANYFLSEAQRLSDNSKVVFNIEDLNVNNKVMSGSGKREIGWNNFFFSKKENRWFIQAFHKAFSDLATHRGIHVIESAPQRTSISCTNCGHCDSNNRDGVKFKCLNCAFEADTDLEIATDNLERVALSGKAIPKLEAACEQLGDTKTCRIARITKNISVSTEIHEEKEIDTIKNTMWDMAQRTPSRKPESNSA